MSPDGRGGRAAGEPAEPHAPNEVIVNVYDITADYNAWTYWCGVGVFHAGVEVYGVEYAYGGHDYESSGVFATNPKDPPGPVAFRRSIRMGTCELTESEVLQLVQAMGLEYRGSAYHLLQKNCNHFANDLCRHLVNKPLPFWINRLAGCAVSLHCFLPLAWVPPLQTPSVRPDDDHRGLLNASAQRSDAPHAEARGPPRLAEGMRG